ncbi:MAG: lysophospholipid acyltransferase family protein [Pseudomonadota bacterium]
MTKRHALKPGPLSHLRGALFMLIAYPVMLVMGVILALPAVFSRTAATRSVQAWNRFAIWLLRIICGTRVEIRGTVPTGPCLIASKHQSFLDVMILTATLPDPRFVMKRSLVWVPVLGIYALRMGNVTIDREAKGQAIRSMERDLTQRRGDAGQTVIYPQGTRIAPGMHAPYRPGVFRLYQSLGLPLELVAVNTGRFWPRTGLWRLPGTAVVEFLGALPPGLSRADVMEQIEIRIEDASDRLMAEAGD